MKVLTEWLRERMNNTKSTIRHPNASSLPSTRYISRCRDLKEPLFRVYPFYQKSDLMFQKFKEWRFINRFKSIFNGKL